MRAASNYLKAGLASIVGIEVCAALLSLCPAWAFGNLAESIVAGASAVIGAYLALTIIFVGWSKSTARYRTVCILVSLLLGTVGVLIPWKVWRHNVSIVVIDNIPVAKGRIRELLELAGISEQFASDEIINVGIRRPVRSIEFGLPTRAMVLWTTYDWKLLVLTGNRQDRSTFVSHSFNAPSMPAFVERYAHEGSRGPARHEITVYWCNVGSVALIWSTGTTLVLFGGVAMLDWARIRRRRRLGLCVKCGYDLRGLPEPRCPECGRKFDPTEAEAIPPPTD
ncbi:MAG: hypothetical protein J5J06_03675 [Phycisphaerae bacterium]|nr:hypothetical protein [Phycisphaerae bacterium]